jgi:hypothetical protein
MGSSLFSSFGQNNSYGNNSVNDFFSHINEFNNFKNSFKGNPQQQVEMLLKNGQLPQEQFQQYAQIANLIRPLLK